MSIYWGGGGGLCWGKIRQPTVKYLDNKIVPDIGSSILPSSPLIPAPHPHHGGRNASNEHRHGDGNIPDGLSNAEFHELLLARLPAPPRRSSDAGTSTPGGGGSLPRSSSNSAAEMWQSPSGEPESNHFLRASGTQPRM